MQKTKIISVKLARKSQYEIPLSWHNAAGIISDKRMDGLKYQKEIRREWGKRIKKQMSKKIKIKK